MRTSHPRSPLLLLALALCPGACGTGDAPVAAASSAILAERPGLVEAVWKLYSNGEAARVSYASPALFLPGMNSNLCSAAMIGPNILMSAAHCGQAEVLASFLGYAANNNTSTVWENFNCHSLLSTWHSSDLVLYYCDPNAAGQNPGDKYGYLDFDSRAPAVGSGVYSVWANPIASQSIADARLYSWGQVTSTQGTGTFTTNPFAVQLVPPGWIPGTPITGTPDASWRPHYLTSYQRPIAVETSAWSDAGASGSVQVSDLSHKILLGPLAQGFYDGAYRTTLSMQRYLQDGYVNCGDPTQVRSAYLSTLGIQSPSQFCGLLDSNGDGVFDVQRELERLRGESRRPVYYLGFDSPRRNLQWTVMLGALPAFDPIAGELRLRRSGGADADLLQHRTLNLAPGAYRVTAKVRSNTASGQWIWLGFSSPTGGYQGAWVMVPAGGSFRTVSVDATVPASSFASSLVISGSGNVDVQLRDLVVLKEDAALDFDDADRRQGFGTIPLLARTPVVPRGNGAGMNWALRVSSPVNGSTHYVTSSDVLGFVPGARYGVCADFRIETGAPQGAMRVFAESGELAAIPFYIYPAWQRLCISSFTAGVGTALQLGFSGVGGSYLVDNISVVRLP